MKLTEIDESKVTTDEADKLIRDISRSSNSQNKVSDADFLASHPFHRQMEQISKLSYAPAKNGAQYETIWFYERARGQYLQEQMRLTPAKKNAFLLKNPKDQLIKKNRSGQGSEYMVLEPGENGQKREKTATGRSISSFLQLEWTNTPSKGGILKTNSDLEEILSQALAAMKAEGCEVSVSSA